MPGAIDWAIVPPTCRFAPDRRVMCWVKAKSGSGCTFHCIPPVKRIANENGDSEESPAKRPRLEKSEEEEKKEDDDDSEEEEEEAIDEAINNNTVSEIVEAIENESDSDSIFGEDSPGQEEEVDMEPAFNEAFLDLENESAMDSLSGGDFPEQEGPTEATVEAAVEEPTTSPVDCTAPLFLETPVAPAPTKPSVRSQLALPPRPVLPPKPQPLPTPQPLPSTTPFSIPGITRVDSGLGSSPPATKQTRRAPPPPAALKPCPATASRLDLLMAEERATQERLKAQQNEIARLEDEAAAARAAAAKAQADDEVVEMANQDAWIQAQLAHSVPLTNAEGLTAKQLRRKVRTEKCRKGREALRKRREALAHLPAGFGAAPEKSKTDVFMESLAKSKVGVLKRTPGSALCPVLVDE